MSLRYKLIIFLILVTIIPGVTAIFATYYFTTESIKEQIIRENSNTIYKGKADLRDYFLTISEIPLVLYSNRQFMNVMEQGINEELSQSQAELKRSLFSIYHSRKEIEQVFLYVEKGNDAYTIYNSKLSSRGKVKDKYQNPYYLKLHEQGRFFIIEPTHEIYSYNNQSNIFPSLVKQVLSFHTYLYEVTSSKPLGFISIDIDIEAVQTIADRLYFMDEEDFYLINDSGVVIYSSEDSLIGLKIEEAWVQFIRENIHEKNSYEWNDSDFNGVIVFDEFIAPFDDWLIVKRIPSERIYSRPKNIAIINILILAVSLILIILATVFVSFKVISPLKILMSNMKKVEEGKMVVEF
ncbi:MAG: cache domain-containing protein, partial [Bacillaceae bacterium]|nr:cache domain-containing protein [Bacillaceae bacterium]